MGFLIAAHSGAGKGKTHPICNKGNPAPGEPARGREHQYSDASMIVKTRTVCFGSLGSSLPFVMVVS